VCYRNITLRWARFNATHPEGEEPALTHASAIDRDA
jgi:hypothetical protein